jgi:integrase
LQVTDENAAISLPTCINFVLRINDLLSLKLKDVLNKKGEIVEYLHLKEQKTKREKKIKINIVVKEALEYYF